MDSLTKIEMGLQYIQSFTTDDQSAAWIAPSVASLDSKTGHAFDF